MKSFLRVLLSFDLFLLGVLLVLLPWMEYWEHNFFLDRYPAIIPFMLHPSFRGVVSGLGALDIVMATNTLRGRTDSIATRT
jgi:hypothetical protein